MMTIISLIVLIVIITTELSLIGTVKNESISLVQKNLFEYDYRDVIPLHAGIWFYLG